MKKFDVVIIGAGPAGLYASIVLKRGIPTQNIAEDISVCIIEQGDLGGLTKYAFITISKKWGFSGGKLVRTFAEETKELGTVINEHERVEEVTPHGEGMKIVTNKDTYWSKYVILANGIIADPDILQEDNIEIGLHSSKFMLEDIIEAKAEKVLLVGPDMGSLNNLKNDIYSQSKDSNFSIDCKVMDEETVRKKRLDYDLILVDYNSYKVLNNSTDSIKIENLEKSKGFTLTNEFGETNIKNLYAVGTTANIISGVLISLSSALITALYIGRKLNKKTISEPSGRFPWFPRESSWEDSWLPLFENENFGDDIDEDSKF